MSIRVLSLAALTGLVGLPAVGPSNPTTLRYRVDVTTESVVDLSAFGAPEQRQSNELSAFLSITLRDSSGGQAMTLVIDSLLADSVTAVTAKAMLDSTAGATWHGYVDARWRISGLKASRPTLLTGQLEGVLAGFFPRIRPGLSAGSTWSDTLDFSSESETGTTSARTFTNYSAAGPAEFAGQQAMKIASAYSTSTTGIQNSPQGAVNIDGAGTGTGTFYITPGPKSRYLGGSSETNTDLTVISPGAPAPIPVKAKSVIAVTLLK